MVTPMGMALVGQRFMLFTIILAPRFQPQTQPHFTPRFFEQLYTPVKICARSLVHPPINYYSKA